jgi:hypothetical protein
MAKKKAARSVSVELVRQSKGGGFEAQLVNLYDDKRLKVGAGILLDDDAQPWHVSSVHRCIKKADGSRDHRKCFQ